MAADLPTNLRSELFGAQRATAACQSRSGITTISEKRRHS
ncbi:hypothetical protein DSM43518_02290 [Mycobacterium marinum]|nr:hypothetical protein DSM43518_02290 [Mycobacterium marinum]RFZ63032.1 hypothetical protein DE4576_04971 [Mycobacterium marinum]